MGLILHGSERDDTCASRPADSCASLASSSKPRRATGNHLWADRFDAVMTDVFEVQDRITAAVAGALAPRVLD
jgi:hypothetical protein